MRRRDRGSVFVYALAVIAVLTVFVVAAAERLRVEADLQLRRLDLTRAERAADAGLARALASLPAANLNALTNQDEWWNLGQAGNEEFLVGSGSFRIQIIDAGSLVNLNNATEEQLLNLPLSQEQVDSLQDWREEGQTPRPLGAKDEFYNNLAFPYNAALRRLDTVTEVLAIRGFDAATLYEPPAGDRVRALTNASADVQLPLIDLVTVDSTAPNVSNDGTARTNLNTAQVGALVQAGFRQQSAQALIARRGGGFAGLR
ncbi:MAG: type II secretion system protein GspK, partial [Fimbriimonadaceae bacterium]|nr:type II secretion system protein GspK [Fimbriimonadaceae bacterium]